MEDRFEFYDLAILRSALRNNERDEITGFLHRNEDSYFQYIEGPQIPLERLMSLIMEDHRHTDFQTLMQGACETRRFESWSMGFSEGRRIAGSDQPEAVLAFLAQAAAQQDLDLEQYEEARSA